MTPPLTLPKLPGMISDHVIKQAQGNFRKQQLLAKVARGTSLDRAQVPAMHANTPFTQVVPEPARERRKAAAPSSKYHENKKQPKWITNDRQVLRFYAYFTEQVEERGEMVNRVRKFLILFYLTDSSLYITEPRIENSGLPQGTFMKKAIVKTPDNRLYEPQDFQIGKSFKLRGRTFHLVDCDKATRQYYAEKLGTEQPPAIEYPDAKNQSEELVKYKTPLNIQGKIPGKNRAQQFFQNEGKVLRFYCHYNDPHPLYPEQIDYVLHFYLADDTIEIREVRRPNSGRPGFPLLLSRQKVPKIGAPEGRNVLALDLRCGEKIRILSRDFELTDCDEYTRGYYLEKHGVTQEKIQPAPTPKPPKREYIDEDHGILRNVFKPRVPPKKVQDAEELDRKVLRFRAKFANPKTKVESLRQFVVTFYLIDETLAIFEPVQRNSGVVGGKFLDRGSYFQQTPTDGGPKRRFLPRDFFVGASICLEFAPHQKLQIVEADIQTLKYCENHPEMFAYSNTELINKKIISHIKSSQYYSLRSAFQDKDNNQSGTVPSSTLESVFQQLGIRGILNEHEFLTLKRRYAAGEASSFDFIAFCDSIAQVHGKQSPNSEIQSRSSDPVLQVLDLMRCHSTNFRKVFQRLDQSNRKCINRKDFTRTLDFYKVGVSREQGMAVFDKFRSVNGELHYPSFCDNLYNCNFAGPEASFIAPTPELHRPPSPAASTHSRDLSGFSFGPMPEKKIGFASADPSMPTSAPQQEGINLDVVHLLNSKYGHCKYELRKQLRAKDRSKSGLLDEDDFMDAMLSVNKSLSENEKYLLADTYFEAANSRIDYKQFLDCAFKQ